MRKMSDDIQFSNIDEVSENPSIPSYNVVVVDDDENTVEVFSEYLELSGQKVIGKAFDGKQAVELFKHTKPDFVFLDIMMPEYDGFYFLEKIRQINNNSKIIAVTADLTKETEERLEQLHIDSIIYKPFDMDSIISIMQSLANKKQDIIKVQERSHH